MLDILKTVFKIIFTILGFIFFVLIDDEESDNRDHQLDQLSDGLGNYIADGESYTHEEITVAKSRGELYDTYL